jgi:hypothetical protein
VWPRNASANRTSNLAGIVFIDLFGSRHRFETELPAKLEVRFGLEVEHSTSAPGFPVCDRPQFLRVFNALKWQRGF